MAFRWLRVWSSKYLVDVHVSQRTDIVENVLLLCPQGASAIAGLSDRLSPTSVWNHRGAPHTTTWPHGQETKRDILCEGSTAMRITGRVRYKADKIPPKPAQTATNMIGGPPYIL